MNDRECVYTYSIRASTSATVRYGVFARAAWSSLTCHETACQTPVRGLGDNKYFLLDAVLQGPDLFQDLAPGRFVVRLSDSIELCAEARLFGTDGCRERLRQFLAHGHLSTCQLLDGEKVQGTTDELSLQSIDF